MRSYLGKCFAETHLKNNEQIQYHQMHSSVMCLKRVFPQKKHPIRKPSEPIQDLSNLEFTHCMDSNVQQINLSNNNLAL